MGSEGLYITRTIWVGEPKAKIKKIYNLVAKALQAAIDAVKAGISCQELDEVARRIFRNAGVEKYSLRGLGHGVGLEIHEFPRVVMNNEEKIRENMVFTIEPGLYIPDLGGVRLENIVLAEKDKARVLTAAPLFIKV